jgi:protein-L-isoaspartate(D-aspartate) O-methyltransferase
MASAATAEVPLEPATSATGDAGIAILRRTMVERQLRPFDVTDVPLLNRFLETPREIFLPSELAPVVYSDLSLSARGAVETRWVPPPLILARFLQAAEIRPEHKVLDVAGGAGYAAALVGGLAAQVTALESDVELAAQALANLKKIGAANIAVETGPLDQGSQAAPFDIILVHGLVECGVDHLLAQLTPNGRLLAYKRPRAFNGVKAVRIERVDGALGGERPLFDAAAPPLTAFAKAAAFQF